MRADRSVPGDAAPGRRWQVPRLVPLLKLSGAGALAPLGVLLSGGDPVQVGIAVLAAVVLAGWALRDLTVPVRLVADADGLVVVTGYATRRRIDWDRVEAISVDNRPRLGLRTETLEIDAGDGLYLFGRYDLGAQPGEVAATLHALRGTRT